MANTTLPPDQGERTHLPNESDEVFQHRLRVLADADAAAATGGSGGGNKDIGTQEADSNPDYVNKFTGDRSRLRGKELIDSVQLGEASKGGFLYSRRRKAGVIGFVIALLLGGGGAGFFFAPVLAPVMALTNIVDDLNDQLGALQVRGDSMIRARTLPREDRAKAITGCTVISIRCKFATISDRQAAKLKAVGIEITGEERFGNRISPTKYRFQGVDYTAEQWSEQLKTNPAAKNAQLRANNMKFLGFRNTFSIVLEKFNLSRRAPELRGSAQDRVNALLNKASVTDPRNLSFSPAVDKDGNRLTTPDGSPASTLDGDPDGTLYGEEDVEKMKGAINRVNNARPPSKFSQATLSALSVLGYWDIACTIKNMLGAASVAAKVASQAELIQFAMPIASSVQRIQAGDATPEDTEAVGRFFMDTDNRQRINDLSSTVTFTNATDPPSVAATVGTIENPNHGKNGLDSPLFQMSQSGKMQGLGQTESLFSLGYGQNQLLAGVSNAAAIADILVNLGTNKAPGGTDLCRVIQSGPVRILGGIVSIFALVGTGGGSLAVTGIIGVGMMSAMMILDMAINNALQGGSLLNNADLANDPLARMAGFWTGMAGISGQSAQVRGLVPGSEEEIVSYQSMQDEVEQRYVAMETENINQFDVTNQYSFVGSLAASITQYTSTSFDPSALLQNTASLVRGGLTSLVSSASAKTGIDPARLKHCDDQSYKALKIAADVQCNVRYMMPAKDLALDPLAVAEWMETSGMVETNTTSGLPAGYTPPNLRESQNEVESLILGAVNSIVTTNPLPNNYARFLEYCVYRSMPYGETYEESGAIGDGLDETQWQTGEKCMSKDQEVQYFRIYTLDRSVQQALDDEETTTTTAFYDGTVEAVASPVVATDTKLPEAPRDDSTSITALLSSIAQQFRPANPNSSPNIAASQPGTVILARRTLEGMLI